MNVTENDIRKPGNELENGGDGRRRAFPKAAIDRYRRAMGRGAKYGTCGRRGNFGTGRGHGMEDERVYVVIGEKNGYRNFEGVFSDAEKAKRCIAAAVKSRNRGREAGFSYYILPTWVD